MAKDHFVPRHYLRQFSSDISTELVTVSQVWLECIKSKYPNQPLNPEKSHEYFQKKVRADFGKWIQDGLRHSFGTYYHNLRHDIPEVVYVMGNSVGIARKHYVREVTREWMENFWSLKPTSETH